MEKTIGLGDGKNGGGSGGRVPPASRWWGARGAAARPADHPAAQTAQLRQLLGWVWYVALAWSTLSGVAALALRDARIVLAGAVIFGFGCLVLAARRGLRQGNRRAAIATISAAVLGATVLTLAAQPSWWPTLAMTPILAVGIALPYASERDLKLIVVCAWLTVVLAVAGGHVLPRSSGLPAWLDSFLRDASLITSASMALVVLWQYRVRLSGTLEQARKAEERLQREATHDALTGLPNRVLLSERLAGALGRVKEDGSGGAFAVLFLDLDRFKNVNDSLGHVVGDELLKEVAGRISSCVRPADTVARLGGDEFVVLLEGASASDASGLAGRVQEALKAPVKLHGHELYATASMGVVESPAGYDGPEELLRDADTAMYRAKEAGKARHAVFDGRMRREAVSLLRLETDLRRAVEGEEFVVFYQPIVWLHMGGVVGFEALVRWEHPERGLLSPGAFVPLAEETGLIAEIDRFVLGEACRQAALWRGRFEDRFPPSVSVNLSPSGLGRPGLVEEVARVLVETGLPGRALALELTEGAVLGNPEEAIAVLGRLRELGVRIHVDDFGTGHSSLALLHRLPVDALKVDRSFVARMVGGARGACEEGEGAEIVRTIATLAHGLGMDVVAEGVETDPQLEALKGMGCDHAQGFRFSRPVDAQGAEAILAAEPAW